MATETAVLPYFARTIQQSVLDGTNGLSIAANHVHIVGLCKSVKNAKAHRTDIFAIAQLSCFSRVHLRPMLPDSAAPCKDSRSFVGVERSFADIFTAALLGLYIDGPSRASVVLSISDGC